MDEVTKLLGITTAVVFVSIITIIAMIIGVFLNAWILLCLWQWYILPFGIMMISFPHAIGLSTIISFLTYHPPQKDHTPHFWIGAVMPFVFLLIGWICHFWMPPVM